MSAPERIVAAAIHYSGLTFSLPAPARHCDLIARLVEIGVPPPVSGTQGFVTSADRFVERDEAARIANAAGQTTDRTTLYSEDVW